MKPVDVEWRTYIDSSKETNDEDPEFKLGHAVRKTKYKKKKKNAKGYIPNWSEEVFVIIKVISDVKGSEIVGKLYEKELQKKPNK